MADSAASQAREPCMVITSGLSAKILFIGCFLLCLSSSEIPEMNQTTSFECRHPTLGRRLGIWLAAIPATGFQIVAVKSLRLHHRLGFDVAFDVFAVPH